MSQRGSGYERQERDLYETPEWVTRALLPHLPRTPPVVLEPAAGGGKMVRALEDAGLVVSARDISDGHDFLQLLACDASAIITNPPYNLAQEFIRHALELTKPHGFVAMLLRTDFDHAKGRNDLFAPRSPFAKKLVLTKRIIWFDRPGAAPSFNHAWYIWDWKHKGPPTLAYDLQEAA